MKKPLKHLFRILCVATVALAASCSTPKNITYFQDLDQTAVLDMADRQMIRIEPEDKISIVVKSKDPALAELFNLSISTNRIGNNTSTSGNTATIRTYSGTSESMSNYTVDPKGDIDFPILGTLHVAGMTRFEVAAFIKGELIGRNLVKDPVVSVEFLNTGISVMGEVTNPGRFDMNRDNITVLDAIALAGDLTIQGQRENVLVLRVENGQMKTYRIDLTNASQMVRSPGFNLKQNDIVYVEPNPMKKRSTTVNGNSVLNASFWVSVASLLTSVAVLIFK